MKSTLVIAFALISSLSFAQSTQQGKVLCYQGADPKTPLSNVSIAATNAPAVLSDAEGAFTLSFRTLHPGDAIQFRRVELNGYEVMNTEALEVARIMRKDSDHDLTIVLAKRETLQKLRAGYKSVASQRYEKQFKATEEQLEQMRKEGKIAEEQYNARLDSLEADYEDKLSKLETYIDKFARIDLSDLDADEQKIIALVQAGDFEGALKIYESQNLPERIKKSREDQAKLVAARDQIAEAASQTERENERLRASIDRQVTLLLMAGGEENQMKVLKIYHEVFLADETNVKARREYALALQNIGGDIEKANEILLEGVRLSNDDIDKGQILIDIAFNNTLTGNDEKVVSYAMQADSLLWPKREKEHKIITRSLPILTHFYIQKIPFVSDPSSLPSYILRLKENWNPDYADPISLADYEEVLVSLIDYDSNHQNHEQSLWDAREAIRLDSCLTAIRPYSSGAFHIYATAASTFAFEGKIEELKEAAHKSAESIINMYPKMKSTGLICSFAFSAYTVMEALVGAECYETADSIATQIDEIGLMERVQAKYPGAVDALVGLYKIYCSQVLVNKGSLAEAKPILEEGLQLLSADEDNALTLAYLKASSYAKIEAAQSNYAKAESFYKEAIEVLTPKDKEPLSSWDADNICHYYLGIADLYKAQGNAKQAKKNIKQAEKYVRFELDKILIEKRNK